MVICMEKSIRRQNKYKFLLGLIYFVGFFLIGMLPWILYGDGFWEQNTFLKVISAVLGFILFVIGYAFIYLNAFSFKPKYLLANIVQGLNIVLLLFSLDSLLLADGTVFSFETSIWLFIIIGLFIILSNLYVFLRYKNYKLVDYEEVKSYIQKLDNTKYDQNEIMFLVHYILIGMFAVIITVDFSDVSDYIIIFAFNAFFIYKCFKTINMDKDKIIIGSIVSAVLYAFVIFVFITFNSFINQHVVVKSILFVLPLIQFIPIIIKAYYSIILKKSIK